MQTPPSAGQLIQFLPKGVKNLSKQKFGDLTPQRIIEISPGEGAIWECLCSCGETRNVLAYYLTAKPQRVTCCQKCARERRTARLHLAYKESRTRLGDSNSRYQRNWQSHLAQMTPGQRAVYDETIARRQRLGITITDAIRAGAVEVAMMERAA